LRASIRPETSAPLTVSEDTEGQVLAEVMLGGRGHGGVLRPPVFLPRGTRLVADSHSEGQRASVVFHARERVPKSELPKLRGKRRFARRLVVPFGSIPGVGGSVTRWTPPHPYDLQVLAIRLWAQFADRMEMSIEQDRGDPITTQLGLCAAIVATGGDEATFQSIRSPVTLYGQLPAPLTIEAGRRLSFTIMNRALGVASEYNNLGLEVVEYRP
jgi:hypothetical protein